LNTPSGSDLTELKSMRIQLRKWTANLKNYQKKKDLSARLCSDCTQMLSSDHSITTSELHTPAKDCALCKLLNHVILRYHSEGQKRIDIVRNGSALKIAEGGPRIIRLLADLGSSTLL
jgi:hypothetical protein